MRERGQIDIVRSATCVDTDDKRMAIRRTADIAAKAVVGTMVYGMLSSEGLADSISPIRQKCRVLIHSGPSGPAKATAPLPK